MAMRMSKSITARVDMWIAIERMAQEQGLSISKMTERIIAIGLNQINGIKDQNESE